jgi:hypothetical protein
MTIRRSNNKKSPRMPSVEERYAWVMRDATEDVFLMAVRRAIDTRLITVEFDAGRGSRPFEEHTLTSSMKETALSVSDHNIPHEWLPVGTGFIDTRFSRVVAALLTDLTAKAQAAGRFL